MSAIEKFTQFLSEFVKTALWQAMETCVEDSPWHREANTAVHTQMMIQWYLENLWTKRSERDRLLTLVLIVFHDVGKPEDRRWSEEKQRYHFSGHEQTSAKRFIDWVRDNPDTSFGLLDLTHVEVDGMYWALYRHVPFTLLEPKTEILKSQMFVAQMDQVFIDLVMCDQYGRISDDHQANQDKVFVWLERWLDTGPTSFGINTDDYPRKISPLPVNGYVMGTQIIA